MVSITIVSILAAVGAAAMAPQISYFRSRRDAENLLNSLRRARALAQARRVAGSDYGVVIYRGALTPTRSAVIPFRTVPAPPPWSPYCYLEYANDLAGLPDVEIGEWPCPASTNLAGLFNESFNVFVRPSAPPIPAHFHRSATIDFHEETEVLVQSGGDGIPDNTRIQFDTRGRLDLARSALGGLRVEGPALNPEGYSFDVSNPNMGYYRIRVLVTGSIEMSSLNDFGTGPFLYDAAGNQQPF